MLLAAAALAGLPISAAVQSPPKGEATSGSPPSEQVSLTPAQLFQLANEAADKGDLRLAKSAYRALAENTDIEIRTEARFRLAMLLADREKKYEEAAVLFRQILDEKPDAARVRIELARMQLLLGNLRSAEREFRAAQAGGLPPEVERLVRFYAQQLSGQKPVGLNFEIAIAPDSNINRATNSETLGTIIGDFTLSDDAQANSGVGLALRGQAFAKQQLGEGADLVIRASASGDFYRTTDFDDYSVVVQAGPQYRLGRDRINFAALAGWRWFGREPFSFTYGANAEYIHPLGKRAQLRISGAITHREDRQNENRTAENFAVTLGYDRAISQRFGLGFRIQGQRDAARDPGFSTALGGVQALAFREFGQTTAVLNFGYSRLEADQRLLLFPERRRDNRYSASIAGTFRALRVGRFAPLVRLNYERNQSTVEINDFSRFAAEIGVTAAF